MKKILGIFMVFFMVLTVFPVYAAGESGTITDELNVDAAYNSSLSAAVGISYLKTGTTFNDPTNYRPAYKSSTIPATNPSIPYIIVKAPVNTALTKIRVKAARAYWSNLNTGDFVFSESAQSMDELTDTTNYTWTDYLPEVTPGTQNWKAKEYTITLNNAKYVKIAFPASYGEAWAAMIQSISFDWVESNWTETTGTYVNDMREAVTRNHIFASERVKQNSGATAYQRLDDTSAVAYIIVKAPINTTFTCVRVSGTMEYGFSNSTKDFTFQTASDDNLNFAAVTAVGDTPVNTSGNTWSRNYVASDLVNAKYVKISFPSVYANSWMSEMKQYGYDWEAIQEDAGCNISSNVTIGGDNADNITDLSGAIYADVNVNSTNSTDINAVLYLAVYDGLSLSKVDVQNVLVKKGDNSFTISGLTKSAGVGDKIKIMLWDIQQKPLVAADIID